MSYDSWTCLMVKNGPGMLPDDVCAALKYAACNLYHQQKAAMVIKSDVCDGFIETDGTSHSVGGRSGTLFRAKIEVEDGEYLVNFLMNGKDLERGADILRRTIEEGELVRGTDTDRIPCDELYKFHDLSRRSHALH